MAAIPFAYPVVLTNNNWQKKKGVTNKGKKTGIGETLVALEKAFAASPFGKLDPAVLGAETLDPVVFRKKLDALKQSLAGASRKLAPLIAASDQKINKAIPVFAEKSSQDVRKHLEQMRADLKKFEGDLGKYADAVENQTKVAYRAKLRSSSPYLALSDAGRTGDAKTKELLAMIKKVEATGTIAGIHTVFGGDGPHRLLTTNCQLWDQLIVKQMPEFAKAMGGPASAMQSVAGLPWLMDVANETSSVATKKAKALAAKSSEEDAVRQFVLEYSKNVIKARQFINIVIKSAAALEKL